MLYFLRQYIACGPVDLVPFFMGDPDIRSLDAIRQAGQIGGTGNGLHLGRMPEDPGKCHGSLGHRIPVGDLFQCFIQFGELVIVQEAALEEAILQGGPGLDGDLVQPAEVQHAAVPVYAGLIVHIHIEFRLDHGPGSWTDH